jgi:hypothetical protein
MMRMLLVLQRSADQETALRQLLDQQQDKSSPNYHKWLTPEEFGARFGPADTDVQSVTSWLRSHGFEIAQVSKGRTVIEFSGTAATVKEAFHTDIHKYVVNAEEHWANAGDPQIPSALTPVVAGVWTMHNFLKKPNVRATEGRIEAQVAPHTKPQFTSSSGLHALGPADYYTIYNFNPLVGIAGSIGIVARLNINLQDVIYFHYWMYDQSIGPEVIVNGPDPGDLGGGEEVEAVLDTTWAGAVSPSSNVLLVVSASTNTTDGVDLSELYIIDHNLTDVMSESFGGCEASVTNSQAMGISALAQQAAAQGITYVVASGDAGSAGCDDPNTESQATHPPSVNVVASSPYTVAVGGTMFNENGHDSTYWNTTNVQSTLESAISYIPENVWNESCSGTKCNAAKPNIWAGGGGASVFFPKPSWQSGMTPADNARDLPDVSLTAAAHDPYLICVAGSCVPDAQGRIFFAAVSGTSASAPAFAGMMALVGAKTGSRQGQANYVLYHLAAAENLAQCNASNTAGLPASTCVFNDVTVGNNAVPGETGYGTASVPYAATKGYDLATGLGSVNVTNLINQWNTVTFRPTVTTFSISTNSAVHGSPINVSMTVAPLSGGGVATGPVWLQGGNPHGNLVGDNTTVVLALDATGAAAGTTHILPGGTYQVNAHYRGDETFAASDSAPPVTVTIQPEPTTTAVSVLASNGSTLAPFTTGPYGTQLYLKAHVGWQSGYGAPTAYVNFWDGLSSVTTQGFVNGSGDAVSPAVSQYAVGSHSITGGYYGDASFSSSVSPAVTFSLSQAATVTAVTSQEATQGATLTATVSTTGYGNAPTGNVTFSSGGTSLGSFPVSGGNAIDGTAQATASFTDSQLAIGQYTITARYAGDSNYTSSTSTPLMVNVQPDFAIAVSMTPVITTRGQNATLSVSITAQNGYAGTASFGPSACNGLPKESSCTFSPPSVTGGGSTQLTISTMGPHIVAASGGLSTGFPAGLAAVGGFALAGICFSGVVRKRRCGAIVVATVAGALLLTAVGCGGSGGGSSSPPSQTDPGTPAGSYTITVTATSGSTTHTSSFLLLVQ